MADENTSLPEIIGDVVGDLAGIPAPVKRNLFKAIGALITGLADVPAAYFEMKAAEYKTRQHGHEIVMTAAAKNAAAFARKSPELAERAISYFANDLVREQTNREAIAKESVRETLSFSTSDLNKEIPVIDDDWLHQFRKLASSKSNTDIQAILAKILAGEIQKPNSFAPNTLEVIARLDQGTAQAFEFVANHAVIIPDSWDVLILSIICSDGVNLEQLFNFSSTVLHLNSCGLLTPAGQHQLDPKYLVSRPSCTLGGQAVVFEKCEAEPPLQPFSLIKSEIVFLTHASGQLQSIIPKKFDVAYARKLQTALKRLGLKIAFPNINIETS